jgi:hypothetical protein
MKKLVSLVAILLLIIFLVVFVRDWRANTSSVVRHKVYIFNTMSGPNHLEYHPGDQWTLNFKRMRGQDSSEITPTQITITAQLIGISSSSSSAKVFDITSGPVIVSMPPIKTNDWTTTDCTRVFQLPKNLAPGDYNFVQTIRYQGNGASSGSSGSGIIHVVS